MPDNQDATTKNSKLWAAIVGLLTAGLVFWILGSQSLIIRLGAAAVGGVVVAYSTYRKSLSNDSGPSQSDDDRK